MKITDCPCECHQRGEWFCEKCDTPEKIEALKELAGDKLNG